MYHHQPSQLLNDLDSILIKYSKNKGRKHIELFPSPDQ